MKLLFFILLLAIPIFPTRETYSKANEKLSHSDPRKSNPVNRPLGIVSESVKRRSSYQTTLPYERRVSALQLDAVKGPQHLIFSGCA